MTEGVLAWSVAVFLLGVLAGGLIWVPFTIREQQREFAKRLELARRYLGLTPHD